jgi:hypothetical protein
VLLFSDDRGSATNNGLDVEIETASAALEKTFFIMMMKCKCIAPLIWGWNLLLPINNITPALDCISVSFILMNALQITDLSKGKNVYTSWTKLHKYLRGTNVKPRLVK